MRVFRFGKRQGLHKGNRKGFTLVEQVISMFLLVLLSGSILGALLSARGSQEQSRQRLQALNFARAQLETLLDRQTYFYSAIPSIPRGVPGNGFAVLPEPPIILDPATGVTAQRTTAVQPIFDGFGNELYLLVTVNVNWQMNKLGSPVAGNENIQMFISR